MNLQKIEKLSPFKHFCMSIGELPSSYMQSLSYLELLLWLCNYLSETVIPAINNNAQAVEELQNLFLQLQNFVDNYFNNLDVQEEINNKLDKMALDGSLSSLISNYIDPIVDRQNSSIQDLFDLVKNASSGSPKQAFNSTQDIINSNPSDGIYLVFENGHIYSWISSSSSLTDLGVYQATQIPENSIVEEFLSNDLENKINSTFSAVFDLNKINFFNPSLPYFENKSLTKNGAIIDSSDTILTDFIEIVPNKSFIFLQSQSNSNLGESITSQGYICFYDYKKNFISSSLPGNFSFKSPNNCKYFRTVFSNLTIFNKLIAIQFFIENQTKNYPIYQYKKLQQNYPTFDYVENLINNLNLSTFNPLFNKKLLVFGDSMAYGHTLETSQTWAGKLAENNNMQLTNLAKNGTTITNVDTVSGESSFPATDSIYAKVMKNLSNPVDADYIIVFGGTNDIARNVELGTIDDDVSTTFYGALNRICNRLIQCYPDKHICFFTPYARYAGNANFETSKKYSDAIVQVCQKHGGIPVFNNIDNGAIDFNNSYQIQKLTLQDTYHLNELGNTRAMQKYSSFLKQL